jgi:hypothetical protein
MALTINRLKLRQFQRIDLQICNSAVIFPKASNEAVGVSWPLSVVTGEKPANLPKVSQSVGVAFAAQSTGKFAA